MILENLINLIMQGFLGNVDFNTKTQKGKKDTKEIMSFVETRYICLALVMFETHVMRLYGF
jgi:hypothetical protein